MGREFVGQDVAEDLGGEALQLLLESHEQILDQHQQQVKGRLLRAHLARTLPILKHSLVLHTIPLELAHQLRHSLLQEPHRISAPVCGHKLLVAVSLLGTEVGADALAALDGLPELLLGVVVGGDGQGLAVGDQHALGQFLVRKLVAD